MSTTADPNCFMCRGEGEYASFSPAEMVRCGCRAASPSPASPADATGCTTPATGALSSSDGSKAQPLGAVASSDDVAGLIERLDAKLKPDEEVGFAYCCGSAPATFAELRALLAALSRLQAEMDDTKQLLDRACEVNIQIQAERNKAEAEREKLEISRSAWADSARINRLRAEQAEADLAAARAEIELLGEQGK
jgi:cell division protein FtsL